MRSENRLKKRKEFSYLYNNGTAKHTAHLTMVYLPTKKRATKVGFSVAKKIGKAHLRNFVKRRLRVIVREFIGKLPDELNIVFIAKPGIESMSFVDLKAEVTQIIQKSGLLICE